MTANGVYKVTAWVRVQESTAGTKIADGITKDMEVAKDMEIFLEKTKIDVDAFQELHVCIMEQLRIEPIRCKHCGVDITPKNFKMNTCKMSIMICHLNV